MKNGNPFGDLTHFEFGLWLVSVAVIIFSFLLSGGGDIITATASIIGVTSLIFIARGYVIGQVLMVVFAVVYGIISFYFRYYGEMITYLGMTAPSAVATAVSWLRHPYGETKEVRVSRIRVKHWVILGVLTAAVTTAFYFILTALGNTNIIFSTLSVATSFIASCLTFLRSRFYAIGYAANDVVLIVLWVLAATEKFSYLPMVLCFVMFLFNDLYGYYSWRKMQLRQAGEN